MAVGAIRWFSGRALLLHLALLVWFPGCLVAMWWQVTVALAGNALGWLYAIEWPVRAELADKEFTSANLLAHLDESAKSAEQNGRPEDAETAELRRFCTPKNAKAVSSKTIGLALKSIVDAPVAVSAGMVALRSRSDTHNKITVFCVELKLGEP